MYSGEARESHLVGIAAHDGSSGVLNPSFHGQPRVNPPVLKGGKGFQTFEHDFLLKANMLDISDHFVGQRVKAVPVGDPLKQKAVLLRDVFLPEETRGVGRSTSERGGQSNPDTMQVTERSFRTSRKMVRPRKRGGHTIPFQQVPRVLDTTKYQPYRSALCP